MTHPKHPTGAQAILAAALLLPGVAVQAENAPEHASMSVRYLDYRQSQPGLDLKVHAPALEVEVPLAAGAWSVAGTLTADDVSGASPRYHTAVSGASHMHDERKAGTLAATRYFERASVSVSAAYSTEHDYISRALGVTGSLSSPDNNTTWSFGVGGSDDRIDPVNHIVVGETRQSVNVMAGITQVLTPRDIGQLTLTATHGHGYFSDPYKLFDTRPRERNQYTLLARWNHHHEALGGTSRVSYRYYGDSFGVRAHTFGGEYVQPLASGWSVTPSARIYTQRAARFYFDPGADPDAFPDAVSSGAPGYASPDQRLSGFGAVTLGLKVARQLGPDWLVDLKVEHYRQRGSWRLFGDGSPGLAPLSASIVQLGLTRQW
ncbi:MAG: DUF3570 domain-containing protein [Gammaproteobacteria bacterium]